MLPLLTGALGNVKLWFGIATIALIASLLWRVSDLKHDVQHEKAAVTALEGKLEASEHARMEMYRVQAINAEMSSKFAPEYRRIEKEYHTTIERINEDVKKGMDRPVGPLLNGYFNSLSDDKSDTSENKD